jgi:hypothetical protein
MSSWFKCGHHLDRKKLAAHMGNYTLMPFMVIQKFYKSVLACFPSRTQDSAVQKMCSYPCRQQNHSLTWRYIKQMKIVLLFHNLVPSNLKSVTPPTTITCSNTDVYRH